jgi:outer membrane receptor for ferrienterochelin and colicin
VDAGYLGDLPVADIAMIKVIKEPFVGAVGNGAGGVIAIYTMKGDDEEDSNTR